MAGIDPWAVGMLLAAVAGGAFGASIGALPSFSLAGLAVALGELADVVADGATLPVDLTGVVGFGVLGPHVAFGGGAAAAAYFARRETIDPDFPYHQAKAITRPLGGRPDVLAVGGCFGLVGYAIAAGSGAVGLPLDPVALGVVCSALAHRAVFGYSLVGAPPRHWLDMGPYERSRAGDEPAAADGGRPTVEPWLPYQYRLGHVAGLGAVVGAVGGFLAYLTASPFLAFGTSAAALALLCADVGDVPVTHHMSLPASTGVLALVPTAAGDLSPAVVSATVPLSTAVLVGTALGVVGALLGEVAQRALYAHADTHLDPPASSIVATSALIGALAMAGVLPSSVWIPLP